MAEDEDGLDEQARAAQRRHIAEERARVERGPRGAPPSRIPRCAPPRVETALTGAAAEGYAAALEQLEAGDDEAAETSLRLSLARNDRRPEAWRELAILMVDQARFEEALRPLDQALALDAEDYEILRFRGICLERLGREDEAVLAYREFLEACPEEHQKVRLHAQRAAETLERARSEALVREEAEADEDALEEVPAEFAAEVADRAATRRVRIGVGVLVAMGLWGLVPGGEPEAPPVPPRLRRTRLQGGEFARGATDAMRGVEGFEDLVEALVGWSAPGAVVPAERLDEVIDALVELGDRPARDALLLLLSHQDSRVRVRGVHALGELVPDSVPELGAVVSYARRTGNSPEFEEALAILGATRAEEAARVLVDAYAAAARNPRRTLRLRRYMGALADALGSMDEELVVPALDRALDRVTPARGPADRSAAKALRELGGGASDGGG